MLFFSLCHLDFVVAKGVDEFQEVTWKRLYELQPYFLNTTFESSYLFPENWKNFPLFVGTLLAVMMNKSRERNGEIHAGSFLKDVTL